MPETSPDKWELAELNRQVEELEAAATVLESQRLEQQRSTARASRRLAYFRAAKKLREPAAKLDMWPIGVIVAGPLACGLLVLVAAELLSGSLSLALLFGVLGVLGGLAVLGSLLYRPSDAVLPGALQEAVSAAELSHLRLHEANEKLAGARRSLGELLSRRRELMASAKVQRAALLQRDWKHMPPQEWEDFVVEVCRTLGASVERQGSLEAGVLMVQEKGRTIAVITRGEGRTVNSRCVQEALAFRERAKTDGCAVIINRRFTGAAQDFASRRSCTLIGVDEFPEFALGSIAI